MERTHFVYRVWDEHDILLYIGCTKAPMQRWIQHRTERKTWVAYAKRFRMQGPFTKTEGFAREKAAIEAERPAFNALTEHRRLQRRNHDERQRVARERRILERYDDLAALVPNGPEWTEIHAALGEAWSDADRIAPPFGDQERHAAYLLRRSEFGLVVVA